MANILLAVLANSMAQILYALSVNRVYQKEVVEIPNDLRWWEMLIYGIYKHQKLGKEFVVGFAVSGISITILTQFGNEDPLVALLHTLFITALFLTDYKHLLLPNVLVGTAFAVELIVQIFTQNPMLYLNLYTVAFLTGVFVVFYVISLATKAGSLGGGDVKIMPFVAMWQGPYVILSLFIASVTLIVYGVTKRKKSAAFGPFLFSSCLVVAIIKPCINEILMKIIM